MEKGVKGNGSYLEQFFITLKSKMDIVLFRKWPYHTVHHPSKAILQLFSLVWTAMAKKRARSHQADVK